MMKFNTGQIVSTHGVVDSVDAAEMMHALSRHTNGDWGDLDEEDKASNDRALESGEERILSVYHTKSGIKFYIITEWDRSVTTFLLPSEY